MSEPVDLTHCDREPIHIPSSIQPHAILLEEPTLRRHHTLTHAPVYYVRDNGIGIAAEHKTLVFQICKRLHGKEEYGEGVGAGLTIVRKIIERHGGRMWLESTSGHGATFFFTLEPDPPNP
jgi:light-regulated signal transduction histidine kinase (bacteriophytochrome)